MPISCPIAFPRLTHEEFAEIDYAVMAHVFATHKYVGRLGDECVYKADLAARLAGAGLGAIRREVPVVVSFRDFAKTYFLDLVVGDRAIYEAKTVAALLAEHIAQVLTYLLLTESTRGKLVNFRPASVEPQFVNTTLTHAERRAFRVDDSAWQGDAVFFDLLLELLRDWSTSLEAGLYTEAMTHLLGGEHAVVRALPMYRDGIALGPQRFHLAAPDTAFRITCFEHPMPLYETHLQRLLGPSPLRRCYWVNIARHTVQFVSFEDSTAHKSQTHKQPCLTT